MRIILGSDHFGYALKEDIKAYLTELGIESTDQGCSNPVDEVDYPDVATAVANRVAHGEFDRAVLVCGTGIGMAMVANKVPGVRAACAHDPYSAERARKSNDAQVLALGAQVVGPSLARSIVDHWLASEFGGGRSARKVEKIKRLDQLPGKLGLLAERLPAGAILTDPTELRIRTHDWWPIAVARDVAGDPPPLPMAVLLPRSTDEVAAVLAWATTTATPIVPRGGGSGVCGAVVTSPASVVLDLSALNAVIAINERSQTVTVQAGAKGDQLEATLNARGLTLGHYPQSLALSTVGGWIATTSAGQATPGYGGIENRLIGYTAVLATGEIVRLRPTPRTAAAPNLRSLFLGAEGTLGVVTEAVLACAPQVAGRCWQVFHLPSFEASLDLAREVLRCGAGAQILRGWDAVDAGRFFAPLGPPEGAIGLVGFDASAPGLEGRQVAVAGIAGSLGGVPLPDRLGDYWWEHRLDAIEAFRTINRSPGSLLDTFEVAGLWGDLPTLYREVGQALATGAEGVGCHFSHVYPTGAALYFSFRVPVAVYTATWDAAIRACHQAGGTMAHHHGIGRLKSAHLREELGDGALGLLRRLKQTLDPAGILNPGVLLPS